MLCAQGDSLDHEGVQDSEENLYTRVAVSQKRVALVGVGLTQLCSFKLTLLRAKRLMSVFASANCTLWSNAQGHAPVAAKIRVTRLTVTTPAKSWRYT